MKYKESFQSKLVFSVREAKRKTGLFGKKLNKALHNKKEYFHSFISKRHHKRDDENRNTQSPRSANGSICSHSSDRSYPKGDRLAVYTCVFGGYDNVSEPFIKGQLCDYYIVTDGKTPEKSAWKRIEPPQYPDGFDTWHPAIKNRYFKMHPDELFKDYRYSLYVDGNVMIKTDVYPFLIQMQNAGAFMGLFQHPIWDCSYAMTDTLIKIKLVDKENALSQNARYLSEGFAEHWGLFECSFILREQHHQKCKDVMNTWWHEYLNGEKRDQMSFTYALWKNGMCFSDICSFGKNWRHHSRLKEKAHNRPHSKVD